MRLQVHGSPHQLPPREPRLPLLLHQRRRLPAVGFRPILALLAALHGGCGEDKQRPPDDMGTIQPGSLIWARGAGGVDDDVAGAAVAVPGGVLVAGAFRDQATFGADQAAQSTLHSAGSEEAFLAMYDTEGQLVWVRADGGTNAEHGESLAADGDGGAWVTGILGGTAVFGAGEPQETTLQTYGSLDMFLARYDAGGMLVWATSAGSFYGHDYGHAVAAAPDGRAFVCGQFTDGAFFDQGQPAETRLTSAGLSGLYLAHYDADGALAWAKGAGGDLEDSAEGVAAAPGGGAFVVGSFSATATFGEGPAEASLASAGGTDAFLARYAGDGALQWIKRAGGDGDDRAAWVAVSPTGELLVAGSFSGAADFGEGDLALSLSSAGGADMFLAGYDLDGALLWVVGAGGPDDDHAEGGAVLDEGAIVTGKFGRDAVFGEGELHETLLQSAGGASDLFVASWDGSGTLRWARSAGGSGVDEGVGAAVLADGSVVAAGRFGISATFGAREAGQASLISAGAGDAFVARFVP